MNNTTLTTAELAAVLDQVPAGITVTDAQGTILYYNTYCTRFVDRKPEYIGRNILSCHNKEQSIVKIKQILADLAAGTLDEVYYETQRGENRFGVTVSKFVFAGKDVGLIQCFSKVNK
ncbi:MAG: PAS domain-containing protein [Desulfovibrionaceae bacterium]|nr:PAS domain-containing protein [Desulfovibrionaceae bacterium]